MTGTARSSAGLDPRRKRILFRAWHRGTREADLIMGSFADCRLASLGEADLQAFEALLEVPDRDVVGWISGRGEVPANHDTPVFRQLRRFHLGVGDGPETGP